MSHRRTARLHPTSSGVRSSYIENAKAKRFRLAADFDCKEVQVEQRSLQEVQMKWNSFTLNSSELKLCYITVAFTTIEHVPNGCVE